MNQAQADAIAAFAKDALQGRSGTALVDVGERTYVVHVEDDQDAVVSEAPAS